MVNIKIVSRYKGPPPPLGQNDRPIAGGPLYPAEEVLSLLREHGGAAIRPITARCIRDVQSLGLGHEDLCDLVVAAVRSGRFIGAKWCAQGARGPWAACDAYQVTRLETVGRAGQEMRMDYYVKFAISCTGAVLLVVSCHISQ